MERQVAYIRMIGFGQFELFMSTEEGQVSLAVSRDGEAIKAAARLFDVDAVWSCWS